VRALALALLTAAALGAAAAPLLAARRPAPTRIQVSALEFEYRLSRLNVRQGPALIELVNYGEDEHDLMLHRVGGTKTWKLRKILPGSRARLSVKLLPGRYRLWCAVADHAGRGMRATLRVRR
jgi:plastocyanin